MEDDKFYAKISSAHSAKFIFIRGVLGCKTNGEALEKIIDSSEKKLRDDLKKKR